MYLLEYLEDGDSVTYKDLSAVTESVMYLLSDEGGYTKGQLRVYEIKRELDIVASFVLK